MIKHFCDRCGESCEATRLARVNVLSVGGDAVATGGYHYYEATTDQSFTHELCEVCYGALRQLLDPVVSHG